MNNNDVQKMMHEFRKEFIYFCKENKNYDERKAKAEELYDKYQPHQLFKLNLDKELFIETELRKVEKSNASIYSIESINPNYIDLNLLIPIKFWPFIPSIIFSIIGLLVLIFSIGILFKFLSLGIFLFGFLISSFLLKKQRRIFWFLENRNDDLLKLKNNFFDIIQFVINTYRKNQYKNGKIKHGKCREDLRILYKKEIVANLKSPYEEEKTSFPINSESVLPIGGVYAWEINGIVKYIGKANNFKRRMKEHVQGLTNPSIHNELKYNSGLNIKDVNIRILAKTNDEDEQSVLESYFFMKYNNNQLLNSTGTLSLKKILTKPKYKLAWDNIKSKI